VSKLPKPYSQELRDCVVKWYDECADYEETVNRYGLHPSTVRGWIKRRKEEGHCNPKPNGHCPRTIDLETLKGLALDEQDHTQKEMAEQLGVSQPVISYHLRQLGITYKKTLLYQNRDEAERQEFIAELAQHEPAQVVFLNESGVDDHERSAYGYALKGQPCFSRQL